MSRKQESFIDFTGPENKDVSEPERGKIELEGEDLTEVERETISQPFQESFTESVRMTPENQQRFAFDRSANLKLGGLFENRIRELTLDRAREFVMENPSDFNLPESMAQRLTDEQIKNLVGENPKLREKIAVDPKLAEIIRLHEIFKKAKGTPDISEKILFFMTIDKLTSQPELIKEIRARLWESMEGIDIDEVATAALGEKDKYVKDKMEAYRRESVERIMISDRDRKEIEKMIDWEIEMRVSEEIRKRESEGGKKLSEEQREEIRAKKEKERSSLQANAIERAISDKKARIEKVLGRSVTDDEIIFLKDKKGIDIANVSSSSEFFGFFKKIIKKISLDGDKRNKSEFDMFLKDKLAGAEDYFAGKAKEFEGEWSERLEKAKDRIIEKSLNDIPADLVRKIYKEKKLTMMAERYRENQLGGDKRKKEQLRKAFNRDGVHINNLLIELGSKENATIEDFNRGIDGFANEDFREYVKKQKVEQSKDKYSLWLLLLELIFGFIRIDNEQK